MIPGIVRNQSQHIVLDRYAIGTLFQNLGISLDGLDREGWSALGLGVLNAVVIHHRESRLLGHDDTEHWLVLIIHSLSAIYQWSTLYGNLALIISHLAVSYNCTDRHIEVDADYIALLDVLDREITLVGIEISLYSLAVYGYAISRLLGYRLSMEQQ